MNSRVAIVGDSNPANVEPGSINTQPARNRIERWVWAAAGLIVLRAAFFAIPYATHGGEVGMFLWLLAIDPKIWTGLSLIVAIIGVFVVVLRRPIFTRPRVFGAGLLATGYIAGWFAPLCVYPSSHDDSPSQVQFRLPLNGPVTVAHGGASTLVNYHAAYPDQRWAYDLVVTRRGKSHRGDGQSLDDYYCYGLPVVAPADGSVVTVVNDEVEMKIGEDSGFKNAGGNQVVIQVADSEFLFICHMQPGSITVKKGDQVTTGLLLGKVGNSGNTTEPHVHIHLQDSPQDGWGEGIPLYFHHYRLGPELVERGMPVGANRLDENPAGQIVENMARKE